MFKKCSFLAVDCKKRINCNFSYVFSIANRNLLRLMRTRNLRFLTMNQTIKVRFTKSDMKTRERKLIPIRPISSWKISACHPRPLNVPWHQLRRIADFPRTRKMMTRKTRTQHRQLLSISEPEEAAPQHRKKVNRKKQQLETFSYLLLRCSGPRSQFNQEFMFLLNLKA
jgi:hypothetical protein